MCERQHWCGAHSLKILLTLRDLMLKPVLMRVSPATMQKSAPATASVVLRIEVGGVRGLQREPAEGRAVDEALWRPDTTSCGGGSAASVHCAALASSRPAGQAHELPGSRAEREQACAHPPL